MRLHETKARAPRRSSGRAIWRNSLAAGVVALTAGICLAGGPTRAASFEKKTDLFLRSEAAQKRQHGWSAVVVQLQGELTPQHELALRELGADVYRHLSLIRSVALR